MSLCFFWGRVASNRGEEDLQNLWLILQFLADSSNQFVNKPIAGAQVPFCPAEKAMQDCWSFIQPSIFKIRGENYFRYVKTNLYIFFGGLFEF